MSQDRDRPAVEGGVFERNGLHLVPFLMVIPEPCGQEPREVPTTPAKSSSGETVQPLRWECEYKPSGGELVKHADED